MKKENFIMQKKENVPFGFSKNRSAAIKVIGVGGGGSNALSYMFEQGITGVDFIACNTDAQALNNNPVPVKIQLGASITEGLGAGADPEIGEKAALESLEEIKSILDSNTKMTFITAGMGGGTGTGAAPIIAGISKEKGILTVGIVTIPFHFEGKMRLQQAQKGIEALRKNVDSLIVINNDKLRELYGNLGFKAGFAKADEVLTTAAKGIAEVITHHYKQNIDLRDTRTVLKESGTAVMGSAISVGENRAKDAVGQALDSPLLNDNKITGAKNVLLLIVSGRIEITIDEIGIISDYIQAEAGNNANIIMGIGEDESLEESISVTIVATGFPTEVQRAINHEEKKIFHRLEEPYKQKLTKIEGIHSYSRRIGPISSKEKAYKSSLRRTTSPKGNLSFNHQRKNVFNQSINHTTNTTVEKKYLLEDNFDLPISSEEKVLKENMKRAHMLKKENNQNEDLNNYEA
ncbi:cell division protein FtsZ [Blattabacterium sp. (Blatta orientalis) str. Tarazona]|uniref:cell division protein FtsZ n=1 Tax=Blattabacterium sp. (Blatta orientalis) TaxID=367806 RepID=UPI0002AD7417|nr:cell division protein FtsZ [Blattabacterium sp. (Blatta orientalis)]AGD98262.1 cell division protein FtsZ [Blattabacterium sp. (Blatta orientalis) str. Tarazona]